MEEHTDDQIACLTTCPLNSSRRGFQVLLDSNDDGVVGRLGSSVLKFAPVGNSPCSPVVIVCGKTPGADTQTRFLAECRRGRTVEVAARSTVQPSKATMKRLNEMNPDCLFSSFRVTPRLRLVVFLDTPSSDAQFHQEHFFAGSQVGKRCIEQSVMLISIPHPSDRNPIYNNLDTLDDLRDKDSRHRNAYLLFKRGAQNVAGLIKRNVIQEQEGEER